MLKNELERLKKENDDINYKLHELNSVMEEKDDEERFLNNMEVNISNFKKLYDFVDITQKRILVKGLIENVVWTTSDEKNILEINLIGTNLFLPCGIIKRR